MAFDFPSSPSLGQTYPQPAVSGQPVYTWDGEKWAVLGNAPAYGPQTAATTPFTPAGQVASVNVQTAIAEVDNEKVAKTGGAITGNLAITGTLTLNAPKSSDALRFHDTTSNTNTTLRPGTTGGGIEFVNNAYSLVSASLDDSGNLLVMNNNVQIGNKPNTSGIFYDAPNGNIGLRGNGGAFLQSAAGASYAVFNGSGSTLYGRSEITGGLLTYSNINIQDGGGSVEVRAAAGQAAITFHNPGAFACNFGMASNGNFYIGGYSYGATAYQVWTSRDFPVPSAPNLAPYVTNGRLIHAGDQGIPYNSTMWEPYGGGLITGCYSLTVSYYVIQQFRFRYLQLFTTGWFTIGYG